MIFGSKMKNICDTIRRRIVKKLETDFILQKSKSTSRPKFALQNKNIERVKRKLEESTHRSTRIISKELKISQPYVWRILRQE